MKQLGFIFLPDKGSRNTEVRFPRVQYILILVYLNINGNFFFHRYDINKT